MLLNSKSLVKTIDNFNETLLRGDPINIEEGIEATRWIISRQGQPGAYREMYAPTATDFKEGIRVFTGEKLESASARHIIGQEAARIVWLYGGSDVATRSSYQRAVGWMREAPDFLASGTFCCGKCTLGFWRHYWTGDFVAREDQLVKGLRAMKNHRLGDGKWRRFPFFYSIYTLLGIDLEPAFAELRYARPQMERYIKKSRQGVYPARKIAICKQALEKVG